MPIDIDEFEARSPVELDAGSEPIESEVLLFLAYDPRKAYTRREIKSSMDANIFAIATCLSSLEAQGYVRHKGSYWTVSEAGREAAQRWQERAEGTPAD